MRLEFIDPGRLRTWMQLEKAIRSEDGVGGFEETWQTVADLFGQLEPVSAQRFHGGGQWQSTVTHLVTIRYRANVSSGMRFVSNNRIFEILHVYDVEERGRYLQCKLKETGC